MAQIFCKHGRLALPARPSTDEEELLARVDWFVTEPPQSARLQAELEDLWASWGPEGPPANAGMMYMLPGPLPANFGPETVAITEEEWDTVVIPAPPAEDWAGGEGAAAADSGGGVVRIVAPAHREELFTQTLELPAPVTLRVLLGAMSDFYCRPLTAAEVEAARAGVEEDSCGHHGRALDKATQGEEVRWCDMLGSAPAPARGVGLTMQPGGGIHRHPMACNGLVRLHGLLPTGPGEYKLLLGS